MGPLPPSCNVDDEMMGPHSPRDVRRGSPAHCVTHYGEITYTVVTDRPNISFPTSMTQVFSRACPTPEAVSGHTPRTVIPRG